MKSSTLIQTFLLATGLMLGGISVAHADRPHSTNPGKGHPHHVQHESHGYGHTPWWAFNRHKEYSHKHQGKHAGSSHDHSRWQSGWRDSHGDHWKHGKYDGRDVRHHDGNHWKHGKHEGRGDGRDRKDHRWHDRHDDAARKGHRSRSASIGYTGRS